MFGSIRIGRHQRGLWFIHEAFMGVLPPGVHRFWRMPLSTPRDRVEVVDTRAVRFEHPMLDLLARSRSLRDALQLVDVSPGERALVWVNNRLRDIHGPGVYAYWAEPHLLDVEIFRTDRPRLEHRRLAEVIESPHALKWLEAIDVPPDQPAVVSKYGGEAGPLPPGRHVFWKGAGIQVRPRRAPHTLADAPDVSIASV